jgi:ribonuclease-3
MPNDKPTLNKTQDTNNTQFVITSEIKQWIKNGTFKKHILNEKNIPITEKFINNIFKTYNFKHKVKKLENYQHAMIHISYLDKDSINEKTASMLWNLEPINPDLEDDAMELEKSCYDRFEFLGDRAIDYSVSQYLYLRYPEQNSGYLTIAKQKIVQKKSLAKLSRKLNLVKYAVIARNMELENARDTNDALAEDLFESFMCAVSLEVSKDQFEQFMINIIDAEIDIPSLMYNNDDYMSKLISEFHAKNFGNPVRTVIFSDNVNKIFKYSIAKSDGTILGIGKAKTKAEAQQLAAKKALISISEKNNNSDDDYYGEVS